jgi:D-glycero-D-manno-heptose 1,7-bisphosphate phosphatase
VGIRAVTTPAVFLDRDGVLVEEIFYSHTGEREAPLRVEDVRLLPGVAPALHRLKSAGYALVVVSNQAAFAKGKTTLRNLRLVHERFLALLDMEDLRLDATYYAYGHPDGVVPYFSGTAINRKPSPYHLFVAAAELDLDLGRSWLVGDQESDIACARAGAVRPILVKSHRSFADELANVERVGDLGEAVCRILRSYA